MNMECNKDYAIKAKEIAERKFNANDMAGAKKFALKAHKLYPDLEGISQMLATLDIYTSAENKIMGEADWYAVLGVPPQADDDTVRKQYRKLALFLHPDKNSSVGAEGAFKLISQAWSLLSDKSKRAAYDAKRNDRPFQQKAKPPSDGSSMPPGASGFYNFAKTTASNSKAKHSTSRSFWTVCHRCKMQFEYLRSYLNHTLLCPHCQQPFLAKETPPPVAKSAEPWNPLHHGKSSQHEVRTKNKSDAGHQAGDFQWVPFSGAAGAKSVAQAADVVQQTYEKVRRVRQEAQAAKVRERAMKRKSHVSENMAGSSIDKKRRVSDKVGFGVRNDQVCPETAGYGFMSSFQARHGVSDSLHHCTIGKFNCARKVTQIELHNVLVRKAKKEISKKLNEWNSVSVLDATAEKAKALNNFHAEDPRMAMVGTNSDLHEAGLKGAEDTSNKAGLLFSESATLVSTADEMIARLSNPVLDPDFYDFDNSRTEMAFEENQVWAVYDSTDGMPRYYVMVHKIISRAPFKLRICWLGSKTNPEFAPSNWVGLGFTKTCGDFRRGRHETFDGLNCFSHKVRWIKGTYGTICIVPRKGEVWAVYRNWSADWNELTSCDVIAKYEIVEVLEDYDEDRGVAVIPLVKVAGFKAVFHRHLDPMQVRRIPKEEVFRFSHQVPSHLLSGQVGRTAPKGCRELDPAALPTEFLQVIPDAVEVSVENQATEEREVVTQEGMNLVNVVTPEVLEKPKKV